MIVPSKYLVAANIDKLKELFPEIVTEGKIDFKVLQDVLGEDIEEGDEYYRFTWAGKAQARREAHKPSTGTLRPAKEESVDWDTTQNLYIEGDNLEVLKLMQKSYAGKVKMIYIDPPYNTGHAFEHYDDNLEHSIWLGLIKSRLNILKNLLSDDGSIWISRAFPENHVFYDWFYKTGQ